jgi:hypothetical protein
VIVQAAGPRVAYGAAAGVVLLGAVVLARWTPVPPSPVSRIRR